MSQRRDFKGYFCPSPWENVVVQEQGNVHACSCSAWIPQPIGNLKKQSWDEVWNGPQAQRVRASILDGSFRYCDTRTCPYLNGAKGRVLHNSEVTDPRYRRIIDENLLTVEAGPRYALLGYDPTCNLSCPSCRCDIIVARGEAFENAQKIHDIVMNHIMPDVERVELSGQGEPFASRIYLALMRDFDREKFPKAHLWLTTNGALLNEKMWESVSPSHGAIRGIHVSINAASPETFAINQRGGDWLETMKNLRFISSLRRSGAIQHLTIGYYVQQNNFREMTKIVEMARELEVDQVTFANMTNWGTFTDEEFARQAVHLPEHPEHEAFKQVLQDPAFLDQRVTLGNLQRFLDEPDALGEEGALKQFDEIAARLTLSEAQSQEIRAIVNAAKDRMLELTKQPAGKDDKSPAELLIGLLGRAFKNSATPQPPKDTMDRVYGDYLDYMNQQCVAGTTDTYFARLVQINNACVGELYERLDEKQRRKMRTLPINHWLDVETGYDPFGKHVWLAALKLRDELPDERTEPLPANARIENLEKLLALLDLDPVGSLQLRKKLDALKDEHLAIHQRCPEGETQSPFDVLVEALRRGGADAKRRFFDISWQKIEPKSGVSYREAFARTEGALRFELRALLGPRKLEQLELIAPVSLLQVNTGYDPLADALRGLLAADKRKVAATG